MRAALVHGAGDIRLEDIAEAGLGPDEVRVAVAAGGICGSDLSYYNKGRVGDFLIREPLVVGHEVSGTVVETGAGVDGIEVGARVAVNPSRPCLVCPACRGGRSNLCRDMRFFGSAAVMPHVQGAMSETAVAHHHQCRPISPSLPFSIAAMAEPLAVCLHAVKRAGDLVGRRVLIAGAGPIGHLVALVARRAGAAHITVFDLADQPLGAVAATAADEVLNTATRPDALATYEAGKGWFDIAFEATGAAPVLPALFRAVRPGGAIIQIGMLPPGEVPVPVNVLMAQEIDLIGAFRFHEEFDLAVDTLVRGRIDVAPVLTHELPLAELREAFELAGDRSRSLKVQLVVS